MGLISRRSTDRAPRSKQQGKGPAFRVHPQVLQQRDRLIRLLAVGPYLHRAAHWIDLRFYPIRLNLVLQVLAFDDIFMSSFSSIDLESPSRIESPVLSTQRHSK